MRRTSLVIAALLALASMATAQTPPAMQLCGARTDGPPYLARYDELTTAGAQYRVRLRYDRHGHAWTPAPALTMPLHHASSLEYDGYTLPAASTATLELTITSIDRRLVSFESGVRTWFFAYRVHVVSACVQAP